jgi:DNA repair exonuclease SbcCD ATPase subunit
MSIATEPTEQKTAIQAFGKRSANRERIQQDEEELKRLLENKEQPPENNPQPAEENDDNLSAEEKSFKKRYGDLRRHSQQQQAQLQKQIDELRQQLESTTKNQMQFPTSEEELAEWTSKFPEVAKIVETIALKKAREQTAEIDKRLRDIGEREVQTAREKAEVELLKIHPDFPQIRDTDDFHEWAEAQPSWVQKALYENDTDALSAARAIDLYKIDRGITKASKKDSGREAAASVGARSQKSAPASQDAEGVIYESQVAKMSTKQYEANMEAIQKAMQTGKFVYDLSGSAR